MGITDTEAVQGMTRVSRAAGTGAGAEDASALMFGLNRGFGISEGTTLSAMGSSRMGGGSGTSNILKTLGIAVAEGLDKTKFADAITSQVSLMERFSGVVTNQGGAGRANEVLFGLSKAGGEWAIGDQRSEGNRSALQEGLANPSSPVAQARAYAVLRRMMPQAGMWDLATAKEAGLATPGYLEATLADIGRGTGNTDFNKFQVQGQFHLSKPAINTIWDEFQRTGTLTDKTKRDYGIDQVTDEAAKHTTSIQLEQTNITNAFRDSFLKGIGEVSSAFVTELGKASGQVGAELVQAFQMALYGATLTNPMLSPLMPLVAPWSAKKADTKGSLTSHKTGASGN